MADDFGELDGSILRDSKFAHLLKPIRDLADNWGIDIANDLEEYLAHLNRTVFTFEGGPTLDFAEAALLIQSTACVYSKKVEYLHNLVYQALEIVRTKKSREDVTATQEGTQRERVARNNNHDMGEDDSLDAFLSAGRNLKEADDIDLAEDDDASAPAYVRPPAALLALEDQGNGAGDGDSGFYRVAQCYVHTSGALLLDANDGDLYDQLLNNTSAAAAAQQLQFQQQLQQQAAALAAAAAGNKQVQRPGEETDDDDGGGGLGDDDDEEEAGNKPATQGTAQAGAASTLGGGAVAVAGAQQGQEAAGGRAAGNLTVVQEEEGEDPSMFDPYKPLDMHSKGSLPIKPLMVKRPGKNRLRPVVLQARKHSQAKALVAGLVHPEFAYAAQLLPQQRARRAGQQRAAATRNAPASVFDQADAAAAVEGLLNQGQEGADEEAWQAHEPAGYGGEDDDDFGGPDMGAYDDAPDAMDLLHDMGAAAPMAALFGDDNMGADGGGEEGGSYEELCRAHIEAMMAAAAAREVQTELAQRVSTWRTKIDPVLKSEESRSNFDIQQYGEKIIHRLVPDKSKSKADTQAPVSFCTVANEMDKFEVSRTFAAMLQLINNKNVAILKGGSPDDPFQLQLLNPELPHKSMGARLNAAPDAAGGAAGALGAGLEGGALGGEGEGVEEEEDYQGARAAAKPVKRPQKKARS